jgi:hypothetical protein
MGRGAHFFNIAACGIATALHPRGNRTPSRCRFCPLLSFVFSGQEPYDSPTPISDSADGLKVQPFALMLLHPKNGRCRLDANLIPQTCYFELAIFHFSLLQPGN